MSFRPCASNSGKYARYMESASRRALDTAAAEVAGRIGRMADKLSSSAMISAMVLRKASAFFLESVETWACNATRISTKAAEGSGMSSNAEGGSLAGVIIRPDKHNADGSGVNHSQGYLRPFAPPIGGLTPPSFARLA